MIKDVDKNSLEAFFEAIPIRMVFIDTQNNIRAMNTNAWQQADVKVEERVGNSILTCHSQESALRVLQVIEDLKSGRENDVIQSFQSKISGKAFREIFTAVKDKDGCYLGTLQLMYDITEELSLRRELEELKAIIQDSAHQLKQG
ncbi:PAS domain-containing protein [Chloroflexota bacterium]